jgi:hypothetical protein
MATLVEEKLIALLRQEEAISQTQKPWVILLGPITTFLDEDVPERETRPLFERMLRKMEEMAMDRVSFFLFQPNPPFTKVGTTRNRGGTGGFVNSKRAFLERRLFQISTVVWRMSLDDEGPKMILEKEPELNTIGNCKLQNEKCKFDGFMKIPKVVVASEAKQSDEIVARTKPVPARRSGHLTRSSC